MQPAQGKLFSHSWKDNEKPSKTAVASKAVYGMNMITVTFKL